MDRSNDQHRSLNIWKASLSHVIHISQVELSGMTENYLAHTLNHYMYQIALHDHPIGIHWLDTNCTQLDQIEKTRSLADICLITCSIFPEKAYHNSCQISFYIQTGQAAYRTVADDVTTRGDEKAMYHELDVLFVPICQTLAMIKQPDMPNNTTSESAPNNQ